LFLNDCVNGLRDLADESIDETVTSPPYDAIRDYHGHSRFDFPSLVQQLYRVTKPNGVVVWVVGDQITQGGLSGTSHHQAIGFQEAGFIIHDEIVYQAHGVRYPNSSRYYNVHQKVFVFSKGRPKTFNPIQDRPNQNAGKSGHGGQMRNRDGSITRRKRDKTYIIKPYGVRTNVWKIVTTNGGPDQLWSAHPAIFPLPLPYDCIHSWSNPNDVVLDPFAGSGQTLIAAMLQGRHFLGFEICPSFYRLIERRLQWYMTSRNQGRINAWIKRHIAYSNEDSRIGVARKARRPRNIVLPKKASRNSAAAAERL
jgi:site-specific DNA-methyltransferase (adenine-specific)